MAPQSIFRGPDVKHYTVVHRSQRDPLINDPEAGDRVLHEVQRQNQTNKQKKKDAKGVTRSELESSLGDLATQIRSNVGEASMYNVYFDDSEYDYMQHLKPVGLSKEAILIEKPKTHKDKNNKSKTGQHLVLRSSSPTEEDGHQASNTQTNRELLQLPNSVQPTPNHEMLSYRDHLEYALPSNSAIPDDGLFPVNDDPALREILDALEDEAYIEDEADDQFFGKIVKDGERDESEELEWMNQLNSQSEPRHMSQWESETARFKYHSTNSSAPEDQFESSSQAGSSTSCQNDVRQQKPTLSNQKASRSECRTSGSLAGSITSMSSSAMFRNEGLTDLDDRFDQIEKEYESSDESESGDSDISNLTATPKMREDFDGIMDEFLDRFEVLGGKMKPVLPGKTPNEKLETMRNALLTSQDADESERMLMKEKILLKLKEEQASHLESEDRETRVERMVYRPDELENKWDCQTILTTYSNLENHPRLIRIRDVIGEAKPKTPADQAPFNSLSSLPTSSDTPIKIDRATGFPIVNGKLIKGNLSKHHVGQSEEDSGSDDDALESIVSGCGTIKRDRNEDKETKKARKAEVKAERANRRQIKKLTKETFSNERVKQERLHQKILVQRSVDIAGSRGKGVMTLL